MALKSMLSAKPDKIKEREGIIEVIKAWKECRNLWDEKLRHAPKPQKEKSWKYLLKLYRKMDPNADLVTVKYKVYGMRDSYKRERKKVQQEKEKGRERWPSLWYFDLLRFLDNKPEDEEPQSETKHHYTSTPHKTKDPASKYTKEEPFYTEDDEENEFFDVPLDEEEPKPKRKKISSINPGTNLIHKNLNTTTSQEALYGQNLGLQLQELNNEQKIIAEKLISDIIFYGRIEKLTVGSCVSLEEN